MAETKQTIMRRFQLTELKASPETAKAFEIFQERTRGFLEMAWLSAWSPKAIEKAFQQYGLDCYTQGCLDGAQAAVMRPELVEFLRSQHPENDNASI